jgi:hypothetical protein
MQTFNIIKTIASIQLFYYFAAVFIGLSAQESGCETTFTFDRKASKSGLFTPIQ